MSHALLRPMRARVLERLAEPGSASSLARELGVARQNVRYHLKELEKQGLLELVEEKKKGNCTERIVKATARAYLVSAEALGKLASDPDAAADRFSSAYLTAVAATAVRDLAGLRRRAEAAGKKLPTFALQSELAFPTAQARHEFAEELAQAVARLISKYHHPKGEGRSYRLFVGMHPSVAKEQGR